jgi:(R,R)-butanediol dehydrogenase/meso-butanediol dehydrogenase/diacetyl reductase
MKAAVFDGPRRPLSIEDIADPVPGPGDLVVRVMACGICGSDLHLADVDAPTGGLRPLPHGAVMGHEFAGEVVAVGHDVRENWKSGARVAALPVWSCGTCDACRAGKSGRCPSGALLGLGALPGAYAEYVRVSAHETVRLPDAVDFHAGATVEPIAVALHAAAAARLGPGESVLVMGAGPIGAAVALWCRFFGARHVIVTDLVDARLERVANLGATACINPGTENVIERAKAIAGERPQVVFDCVGVPGTQALAMDYAPTDGRIVVAGVCMEPDRIVPVKAITKELTVAYVFGYRRQEFAFAVDMLGAGRIDSHAMISSVVGFDGFSAAFDALKRSKTDCKVLLEPAR